MCTKRAAHETYRLTVTDNVSRASKEFVLRGLLKKAIIVFRLMCVHMPLRPGVGNCGIVVLAGPAHALAGPTEHLAAHMTARADASDDMIVNTGAFHISASTQCTLWVPL